jgi:hypothetical protein
MTLKEMEVGNLQRFDCDEEQSRGYIGWSRVPLIVTLLPQC